MFSWIRRRKYRNEVLAIVQATVFEPTTTFLRNLQAYPGMDKAIVSAFDEGRPKEEFAIELATLIVTDVIEGMEDTDRCQRIKHELQSWLGTNDSTAQFLASAKRAEMPADVDAFQWKLQWAVTYVAGLREQGLVDAENESLFRGEILGALDGKPFHNRVASRLSAAIDESLGLPALRDGDNGPLLPTDAGPSRVPALSGTETKVKPLSTATGIILVRKDNDQQITERRSLTQDNLKDVPLDADEYVFVNFQTPSGDLCSCLIVEPGAEVYGSQRAFWWSLAKASVLTTDVQANGTRMTRTAFERVFAQANAMWSSAVDHAGSIDNMRDMLVQLRTVDLDVISQMKAKETTEAGKLGLDIALAMVLATQSEDPKLERFAYQRFKRFLWQPGEEPRAFYQHDQGDVANCSAAN